MRFYVGVSLLFAVLVGGMIFYLEPILKDRLSAETARLDSLLAQREDIRALNEKLVRTTSLYAANHTNMNRTISGRFMNEPDTGDFSGDLSGVNFFGGWVIVKAVDAEWLPDGHEAVNVLSRIDEGLRYTNVIAGKAEMIFSRNSFAEDGDVIEVPILGIRIEKSIVLPLEDARKIPRVLEKLSDAAGRPER